MHDIRLAIGLIGFLSVAIFCVTIRLLKNRSTNATILTAVGTLVLIALYTQYVWGQLWIVQWIPLPSVIVLSNWFPLLLALLAGAVWSNLSRESYVRAIPIMLLIVIGASYSVMRFIPTTPPECGDEWESPYRPGVPPVCIQTTDFTCSAAAAATVLVTYDIPTSEQEMAELCLTRSGTTWLGLYHGLSEKLMGTDLQVEFFECDVSELYELQSQGPMLLCCELSQEAAEALPQYKDAGGWRPGVAHSVVYLGGDRRQHLIGDPSRGYEIWSAQDLGLLWTGQGLRVVPISDSSEQAP